MKELLHKLCLEHCDVEVNLDEICSWELQLHESRRRVENLRFLRDDKKMNEKVARAEINRWRPKDILTHKKKSEYPINYTTVSYISRMNELSSRATLGVKLVLTSRNVEGKFDDKVTNKEYS